ncbi:DUF5317 family protein [Peptoniphilus equinus]|uniref:DUF5317 family protein n=1 Tax=Peptoniphilus equinus TaxID=3016343 RepID=A0ABY7QSE2_9FIRM|nr:DUF5317 family protein [Peptoniphilus equinus]WBW49246.1 DUF5317 family protein [Peptoniphilus equinus]
MIIIALITGLIVAKIKYHADFSRFNYGGMTLLIVGVVLQVVLTVMTQVYIHPLTEWIIRHYTLWHSLTLVLLTVSVIQAWRQSKNVGYGSIALGLGLNTLVVLTNGKMMVSSEALSRLEPVKRAIIAEGRSLTHGTAQTIRFEVLADIFYLPFPFSTIISIGDVIISVGIVITLILFGKHQESL